MSDPQTSKINVRRRLVYAVVVPLFLLFALIALLSFQVSRLLETSESVDRADEVIFQAQQSLKLVVDMETGMRGYLLTGDRQFLEPWEDGRAALAGQLSHLASLSRGDPQVSLRVGLVRELYQRWLAYAEQVMAVRDAGGDWLTPVKEMRGKHLTDQIRAQVAAITYAEQLDRIHRRTVAAQTTRWVMQTSVGMAVAIAVVLVFFTTRQLTSLATGYRKALADVEAQAASVRENEAMFRAIFEQAAVGIAHMTLDGKLLQANQKLCDITGYPAEVLRTKNVQDITHPEDNASDQEQIRRLVTGEIRSYSMEKRYVRPDGHVVWVSLTSSAIRDERGNVVSLLRVVEDSSARRYMGGPLRRLGSRLRLALDAAEMGTWDLHLATGECAWSEQQEQLFGLEPGTFGGNRESFFDLVHPEDRDDVAERLRRAIEAESEYEAEYRVVLRDGTTRWIADHGDIIRDRHGHPSHVIGVSFDVSVRRSARLDPADGERRSSL